MPPNKRLLVALLFIFGSYCHSITLSSPSFNAVLVAGSTTPVSWSGNTDKTVTFDILLNIYTSETTKREESTVSVLATNIDASETQPLFVFIPDNLNFTKTYAISLTKASTSFSFSSVGPLLIGPSKINVSNSTPPTVTQYPTLMVSRKSPDLTSTPVSLSLSFDVSDTERSGSDVGPTLTSVKAACIALSVVFFASCLFGVYVLIKAIIRRRKKRNAEVAVDLSTNRDLVTGYYATPTTKNRKKTALDNIDTIRNYQGLYYTEGFTDVEPYTAISVKGNRKRPTSPLHISSDDHPFGQPPQNFNQNAYYIYNELPLTPEQAYGSYHTSPITENRAASRSSHRRMSSPTIPQLSPTLTHT